ncbi:hypothetical protein PsorP6_012231 [Peronosclerospora sorghi]|uniref:Uncharacterized protein n=1 Tax=Peronosclerospora sorghi TaxID=230839 RepID=A0ACC0WI35_9STRA|nr:hypothetical protein PsorP6_012231 [Peronosclerospora sorghi]
MNEVTYFTRFSQACDFTKSGQACQCLRELKHYDPNTISKCIRIVNCEGVKIKETPKALKVLNDIVEEFNLFDEFDFGVVKQTLHCSHAASTDHDLTSQVVRPVSALLACAHTAVTDGNEIMLKLLTKKVGINAELSKLLWGDHQSVEHFERGFVHPVDVLHGADVVCWPVLVKPILQTIKYLLMRSSDPLKGTFCCGLLCRAQATEEHFFEEEKALGCAYKRTLSYPRHGRLT